MNKQNVGVIVLTYNSVNFIEDCLQSLFKNPLSQENCVVVDNASIDKTSVIVHKKYPKVKVVNNKNNLGFAAGNNVGLKYLMSKNNISYILILNPDTLVSPKLLPSLTTILDNDETIGVVAPIITYSHQRDKIWYAGGYLNRLFCFTKHPNMNTSIGQKIIPSDTTDFTTGACMLIRKSVLVNFGLLPEDYFMYFEDVDFCQNLKKYGYTSYLYAKPLVKHAVSASAGKSGSNRLTPFRAYYYARNPFIYIKKEVKGVRKYINYLGQFIISLPYFCTKIIISGDIKSLFAYFRGIKDGINFKVKVNKRVSSYF